MRSVVSLLFLWLSISVFAQNIYLIGDAGEPSDPDSNLQLLREKMEEATDEDFLIFLGDNIYPRGLPGREDEQRAEMEAKLTPQLDLMNDFAGRSFMIPGNHDWAQGRKYGWENLQNMESFASAYLNERAAFLPHSGCPGPIEIPMSETATLIILDTQYFLHGWEKPGSDSDCDQKSTLEALDQLRQVIADNQGKHLMIAAHHPMYTYGEHHGNFEFKKHLMPIPGLGSIHPMYRRFFGNIQDVTHPKYRAIRNQIIDAMNQTTNVIYANGHEHNLQWIKRHGHHFITSGSGSKTTHVKQGKGSGFAKSENGFAIVSLSGTGQATVEFWGADSGRLHHGVLYQKDIHIPSTTETLTDYSDSTLKVSATDKFLGSKLKYWWLGKNYREVWAEQVLVPVFDIGKAEGGLSILKKGGGMQTHSLRMEAKDGRQYVLRSVEKYPENAIPTALRKTFAQDVVEDQISASHPYAAFIIPTLAAAAGIYHTNPKLVYIPSDNRFGKYQPLFAGSLALFEERPNREAAADHHFGGGTDIDGTGTVLENLREDNDHSVDQNFVVRNRIFDMWIGDWDRHDDQWRWVEKEGKHGKIYRPIPRDRDQAFFINEGIIPSLASRKWALPKIEGFDEDVRWAPGLSDNARFFDRTFMNEPDWQDWQQTVTHLQEKLSDEVIRNAVTEWPLSIQKLTGERTLKSLKARREDMMTYARELYLFLAREVEVVGSDKHEYFLIEHLREDKTKVTVRKRKKDGELKQKIYTRTFLADETKEIRLYGRDGEDVFEVVGEPSRIKIRIIGGTDPDTFINDNGADKLRRVHVYDRVKSTRFQGNTKGVKRLSTQPEVNSYDRKSFKYDKLMPLITAAVNPDDGLFLGSGFSYIKHGWRKEPYAAKHTLKGFGAFATGSFQLDYQGEIVQALGQWNLEPSVLWQQPFFVNNFFGVGNETVFLKDQSSTGRAIDFYRIRMDRLDLNLNFARALGTQAKYYFGLGYNNISVKENDDRFINTGVVPATVFDENKYARVAIGLQVDSRDHSVLPTAGSTVVAEIEHLESLTSISESTTRVSGEWATYYTARLPAKLTFANRLGAAHNTADFDFFNANTLGGRSNLRGYRRTRFYGRTSFYHNFDMRLKLASFRSYIFPGSVGVLAFHDTGRVWVDGEDSDTWHTGKGVGLWLSPLNTVVLNLNYAFGDDENLLTFYMNFFF